LRARSKRLAIQKSRSGCFHALKDFRRTFADPPSAHRRACSGAAYLRQSLPGTFPRISLAWFIDEKYLDLFFLAFVVPNLFRRLFGEGALTSAFVPVYTERLEAKDAKGPNGLPLPYLRGNLALLGILVLLGEVVCFAVWMTVSDPDHRTLAELFAIMLPYLALICGAAVLMAVLNSHRRFAIPAAAPMLLNLALIAAVYFFARGRDGHIAVRILAVAVIVGGIVQFALQWPAARAVGFRFRARLDFKDPNFRLVIQRIAPVVIGVGVFQINTLIDQLLAYGMIADDGAVTYLQLGTRLVQLPWPLRALPSPPAPCQPFPPTPRARIWTDFAPRSAPPSAPCCF